MAAIHNADTPAQTGPGRPEENPDGIGQTLGGDLLRPNPGHDLPPEDEDDDD